MSCRTSTIYPWTLQILMPNTSYFSSTFTQQRNHVKISLSERSQTWLEIIWTLNIVVQWPTCSKCCNVAQLIQLGNAPPSKTSMNSLSRHCYVQPLQDHSHKHLCLHYHPSQPSSQSFTRNAKISTSDVSNTNKNPLRISSLAWPHYFLSCPCWCFDAIDSLSGSINAHYFSQSAEIKIAALISWLNRIIDSDWLG